MPGSASEDTGLDAASNVMVVGTRGAEIQPPIPEEKSRNLVQLGAVQYYNNYPGNAGQQMSWTNDPQAGPAPPLQGNAACFPYPVNWTQQEEAVTSFALEAYQGYHGFAVSLKPETFLNLSREQQAAIVRLGRGNNFDSHVAPAPPPKAPVILDSAADAEPPKPATEQQKPKCVECDKQITINILPQHCNSVPLCGPCYHGAMRQCSLQYRYTCMLNLQGHTLLSLCWGS